MCHLVMVKARDPVRKVITMCSCLLWKLKTEDSSFHSWASVHSLVLSDRRLSLRILILE